MNQSTSRTLFYMMLLACTGTYFMYNNQERSEAFKSMFPKFKSGNGLMSKAKTSRLLSASAEGGNTWEDGQMVVFYVATGLFGALIIYGLCKCAKVRDIPLGPFLILVGAIASAVGPSSDDDKIGIDQTIEYVITMSPHTFMAVFLPG